MKKDNQMTKGQEIEMHRDQIEQLGQMMMGMQSHLQHIQQGIQMVMQSVDGQKLMLNAIVNVVQGVTQDKLGLSKEEFEKLLEDAFQRELERYRAELEAAMEKKTQEQEDQMAFTSEPIDDEENEDESSSESVDLSNVLRFPGS